METMNIHSIGHAAQLLQAMPKRIRAAAQAIGVEPACRINGVDHYSEDQLEQIRTQLQVAKPTRGRHKKPAHSAPILAAVDNAPQQARTAMLDTTPQRRQRG